MVEAQHVVATRKLVDSAEDQEVLEGLLDAVKPPAPSADVHYLLSTPFRYRPLRHGSRFGRATEGGIWYGAETMEAALAEKAYYRFVFLSGTGASLGLLEMEHTAFRVRARTGSGTDLTASPFVEVRDRVASRSRYDETQELGAALRQRGVEAFRYPSARDPAGGVNVAVLAVAPFGHEGPRDFTTWHAAASPEAVEFRRRDVRGHEIHRFERELFLVDGALPAPAV